MKISDPVDDSDDSSDIVVKFVTRYWTDARNSLPARITPRDFDIAGRYLAFDDEQSPVTPSSQ